jgi:hypothetical protein
VILATAMYRWVKVSVLLLAVFKGKTLLLKKPVDVDKKGIPYGKMVAPFVVDIQSLARDLDPSLGYANQKEDARIRI